MIIYFEQYWIFLIFPCECSKIYFKIMNFNSPRWNFVPQIIFSPCDHFYEIEIQLLLVYHQMKFDNKKLWITFMLNTKQIGISPTRIKTLNNTIKSITSNCGNNFILDSCQCTYNNLNTVYKSNCLPWIHKIDVSSLTNTFKFIRIQLNFSTYFVCYCLFLFFFVALINLITSVRFLSVHVIN